MPISRPPCTSARSSAGSPSIVSRSFSSAGLPASSPMTWPSAAVIVSSGPIGAAPCETHGRISTSSSRTPTAPSSSTSIAVEQGGGAAGGSGGGEAAEQRHGGRSLGQELEDGVGRERRRVGEQDHARRRRRGRASRPARRCPPRAPRPGRGTSSPTPRRGGRPRPTPRCPARPRGAPPITPPAAQPASAAGDSASWTASSTASGAARCVPDANTMARSHDSPARPSRAVSAASRAPARWSGLVDRPAPMWTGMRNDDTPRVLSVVAVFGPTGVGKTAVALALAERLRADGEDPVAVSADALQVYRGLETLTGAATTADRAAPRASPAGVPARRRSRSAPARTRGCAHAEIDALLAHERRPIVVGGTGLYLRAALAELDLRPPVPARSATSAAASSKNAAPPRSTMSSRLARRTPPRRSARPTPSASPARSSCSTPATSRPRASSSGPRTPATRRCSPA